MKIFLGSTVYRTVEVPHHMAMLQLQEFCTRNGIDLEVGVVRGDALVSRSRSIAASAFLRSDADVLLSIDADIRFQPVDAIALCQKALEKKIIGALYMTRNLHTQPALMLGEGEVTFAPDAQPVEVPFASTGFMAVTREPFERLAEGLPLCHESWGASAFWPFYMPYVIEWPGDGHMYLSEDWAFCQRAKDAGFKIWLDPSIRLSHHGDYAYELEDLLRPPKPSAVPLSLTRHSDGSLETHVLVKEYERERPQSIR